MVLVSSPIPSDIAAAELGALLTGSEARAVADRLADGDTTTVALTWVAAQHRTEVRTLLDALADRQQAVLVLRAIAGARAARTSVEPLWTLPGALAGSGRLTSQVTHLVDGARQSVVCSTFNFQRSSGLWEALRRAAHRPGLSVRVYLDARAADRRPASWTPTTAQVAAHLHPARVLRTKTFDGGYVRNHAKFLVIDHRFLLVTSANFSRSAEHENVEFGLYLDNSNLAEAVERQLREIEDLVYEPIADE
ncbi:DISARM system phospholipase D-like protein DrmC [Nocardia rhamnosiphila]|uniref:DISARM system phospholipase D-like protein DrmC n=1 Tax=Nocardia rhamnosiphila TaxID=426716 RepID=UPI0033D2B9EB